MAKLILASSSPRRKQILEDHGFKFIVVPADIKEEEYENLPPLIMVKKLARLKAEKVAENHKDSTILSADTTVNLNGKVIGKPKDKKHAKQILRKLSGSTHEVITGYAISDSGKINLYYEKTQITFFKLTENQIDNYIKDVNVLGFAGAYGIQDKADKFVKEIKGDRLNIVGLPTKAIKMLKKMVK